jgi:hypothetical protein
VRLASEIGIAVVCFIIAVGLTWIGRLYSHRLAQNGFVFVSYPALVLVFISIGASTLLSGLLR